MKRVIAPLLLPASLLLMACAPDRSAWFEPDWDRVL